MKRALLACLVCVGVLWGSVAAWADDHKIFAETAISIPGRYAAIRIEDFDRILDQDIILAFAKEQFEKANVSQFQWVLMTPGGKPGDMIPRAFGEMRKDKNAKITPFAKIEGAPTDESLLDSIVKKLGYWTTPKELYDAYSDNAVVADEDFKGKPVFLEIIVPQLSKDADGDPYIDVGMDGSAVRGIRVYLKKDDPFLRRIKKGSKVVVHGEPRGFRADTVFVVGEIISADGLTRPDELIEQCDKLNDICRDGRGDDSGKKACDQRDALGTQIHQAGWCWGHGDQGQAERNWEPCWPGE